MKRFVIVIIAFALGAIVASLGWAYYTFKKQTELSILYSTMLHGHATVAEDMLSFLEKPDPVLARRLTFAASNSIALFPRDIAALDEEYPYVHFTQRYASECQRFEKFMRDRQARAHTNTVTSPK